MKRSIALLLVLLMMCIAGTAAACGTHILIPDSDTRLLFEEEVRAYHVDTLGYILNEIFARHGYHFDPEGRYKEHFENLNYVEPEDHGFPYCEAPTEVTNEEIIAGLSDIEFKNIALIKRVQDEKRANGDESGYYEEWCCEESDYCTPKIGENWKWADLPVNLKIPVYSGPGEHYVRGADGRAYVSSNEEIWACGFDGDWLMITYLVHAEEEQVCHEYVKDGETHYYYDYEEQARVGYIHKDAYGGRDLNEKIDISEYWDEEDMKSDMLLQMEFILSDITLSSDVDLTDDPAGIQTPLVSLEAGETVTLLSKFPTDEELWEGQKQWLYVEYAGEKPARGFIPAECIQ